MTRSLIGLILCLPLAVFCLDRSRATADEGPLLPGLGNASPDGSAVEEAPAAPPGPVPRPIASPRIVSPRPAPVTRGLDSDLESPIDDRNSQPGQSSRRDYSHAPSEIPRGEAPAKPEPIQSQPSRPTGDDAQRSLPSSRRGQGNSALIRQAAPSQPSQPDQQSRLQQQMRLQQQQRLQEQQRLKQQQLLQQQRVRQQQQQLQQQRAPFGASSNDPRRGQPSARSLTPAQRSQAAAREQWEQPSGPSTYQRGAVPPPPSTPSYRSTSPQTRNDQPRQPSTPNARTYRPATQAPSRATSQQRSPGRPATSLLAKPENQQPQARNIPRPPWEANRRTAR
jgi:hypothetical protein